MSCLEWEHGKASPAENCRLVRLSGQQPGACSALGVSWSFEEPFAGVEGGAPAGNAARAAGVCCCRGTAGTVNRQVE